MKNNLIEWKKPIIKSATFEEISEYVKAMAKSGGIACVSCGATGCNIVECVSCGCSGGCNPIALLLSCTGFLLLGRSMDGEE
ncbi:MAG: hypothetical protein IJN03_03005 [Bacilli bacterium]|nr:hypothetical protein [Bacilli bacterium]